MHTCPVISDYAILHMTSSHHLGAFPLEPLPDHLIPTAAPHLPISSPLYVALIHAHLLSLLPLHFSLNFFYPS